MKKPLIIILLIGVSSLFSFNTFSPSNVDQKPENLKHLQVKITGMTCEIGCARTIEAKISKMSGVKYSKVNFNESIGQFSYDSSKTSADKIINKINSIAGGGVYQVVESKEVKAFKK